MMELEARVKSNVRLSDDYNVVTLEAPSIAANADPGQFVMVKLSDSQEPLLRRPFSIFEICRNSAGTPTGFSLLNKRIGLVTQQIFDLTEDIRFLNNNYERLIIYALTVINMAIVLINVRLKSLFLKRKDQDVSAVRNMDIIVPIVPINLNPKRKNLNKLQMTTK